MYLDQIEDQNIKALALLSDEESSVDTLSKAVSANITR